MKKINLKIDLLERQTNEFVETDINLSKLMEIHKNQKSNFHDNYIVDVEIEFDGFDYKIEDFNSEFYNEPLEKIENISKYGWKLEDLEHMYHECTRRDEIPELYDIEDNTFENILDYFGGDETEAKEAMKNYEYSKHDEYVYYSYATDLISFDEVPYEDYSEDIFELWLKEIIYL